MKKLSLIFIFIFSISLSMFSESSTSIDSYIIEKYLHGLNYFYQGDTERASQCFESIVAVKDDLFMPFKYLTKIYRDKNRSLDLVEDYLLRHPCHIPALEVFAELLISHYRHQEAIGTLKNMLMIIDDSVDYHNYTKNKYLAKLGRLLYYYGDKGEARDYLLKYINRSSGDLPMDELYCYLLADIFESEKEYSLAAYYYMKSIEIHPYYHNSLERLNLLLTENKIPVDIPMFYKKMIHRGENTEYFIDEFISYVINNNQAEYLQIVIDMTREKFQKRRDVDTYRKMLYAKYLNKDFDLVIKALLAILESEHQMLNDQMQLLLFYSLLKNEQFFQARQLLYDEFDSFSEIDIKILDYELSLHEGDRNASLGIIRKLHENNINSDKIFLEYIKALFLNGQYDNKVMELIKQRLTTIRKDDVRLWIQYINALIDMNYHEMASECLMELLRENPNERDLYIYIMHLIVNYPELRHKADIAKEFFELYDDIQDQLLTAEFYIQVRKFEKAEKFLDRIAGAHGNKKAVLSSFSSFYYKKGQLDKAISILETLHEKSPYSPGVSNSLSYLYILKGINMEKAYELIRYALRIEPLNPAFLDTLGWYYYTIEDYKTALVYLSKAHRIMPDDPEISEHLGFLHLGMDHIEKARYFFILSKENYKDPIDIERMNEKIESLNPLQ